MIDSTTTSNIFLSMFENMCNRGNDGDGGNGKKTKQNKTALPPHLRGEGVAETREGRRWLAEACLYLFKLQARTRQHAALQRRKLRSLCTLERSGR